MVSTQLQDDQQEEVRDVVIPYVRSGDGGQELRRSLRTLKNIGDWSGRVWILGEYESWFEDLVGLTFIAVKAGDNKFVGIQDALVKACNTPEISEVFYYSNDDIYINDAFLSIPPMYREDLSEQEATANSFYAQSLAATKRLLERQKLFPEFQIVNYETHTPLPVVKKQLKATLEAIQKIQASGYMTLQLRTYYGNTWGIGGEFYEDGKNKEGLAITSS